MNKLRQYSPFFDTIADEDPSHSLLKIGRGHHFSVLQLKNREHRFLVIWDEDHDTRIIDVIEQMLLEPDRFPFKFRDVISFGESKGNLSIITTLDSQAKYMDLGSIETSDGDIWQMDMHDMYGICDGDGMLEMIKYLSNTFGIKDIMDEVDRLLYDLMGPIPKKERLAVQGSSLKEADRRMREQMKQSRMKNPKKEV